MSDEMRDALREQVAEALWDSLSQPESDPKRRVRAAADAVLALIPAPDPSHEVEKSPHGPASSFWCQTCMAAGIWPNNFDTLFPAPHPQGGTPDWMTAEAWALMPEERALLALGELRALSEAATPGPWSPDAWYVVGQVPTGRPGGEVIGDARRVADMRPTVDGLATPGRANAALIAAAVNHVRALLAATPAPTEGEAGK